ncbi:DUF6777 domain-containing protein [Streptomyces sp. NPDC006610]|uniref:DUF6777 domain-containing protein n=1 Tax=Streptomyces sp. NPDC006610 TaxID=3154584 RepID=UPI00339EE538
MSVEPPSSGRPTGPPSGPLSGPSQPPSGPPSPPPGGGASQAPQPRRPWWRSVPRIAVLAVLAAAAVAVAFVLTRPDGGSNTVAGGGGELFLQAAGKSGPDPFTESTAKDSSAPPATPSATESAPPGAVRGVDGGDPGLYGGTRNSASCDVERQIRFLERDPAKNRAFAAVADVRPSEVPAHLRSLTPVQLRLDTRVTNHGYRDGVATPYQAVLQAGTAVLVDGRGVPRVRCACGNPLTPPVALRGTPERTGDTWPSYRPSNVVFVNPAPKPVKEFVLYDDERGEWIARPKGDTGKKDRETEPPKDRGTPSAEVSTPAASASCSPEPGGPPVACSPHPEDGSEPAPRPEPETPTPSEPPAPEPEAPEDPDPPRSPESPAAPEAPEAPADSAPPDSGT